MSELLPFTVIVSLLVALSYQQKALVSFDEFANAIKNNGYPNPTKEQYDSFVQGLPKGLITTKEEAAMALTQFLHESQGLTKKVEIQCKETGCPGQYQVPGKLRQFFISCEQRLDKVQQSSDCDAPGKKYFGRGYIQLSWCYNYKDASHDLYGDDSLVNDPDKVARDENTAWDTAFWFWKVLKKK